MISAPPRPDISDRHVPPPQNGRPRPGRVRRALTGRWLLLAATVVATVLAVVTAFHDLPAVARALRGFDWRLLPLAIAVSTIMHGLRFVRWHLYAGRVAGPALRGRDSLVIYAAGMGTHLTPGRVGEAVRCAFLRRAADTPVARSAPIIVAERVTDGIGLFGLAVPGAVALGLGGPLALPLLALPLLALPLLASRRAHRTALVLAGHVPLLHRFTDSLTDAGEELRGLMTPRLLVAAAALSMASVALEVATFAIVLRGVGLALTSEAFVRAAFVLPAAMLASAVFIVPGNLGVAEGGLAALTRSVLTVPAAAAAAAAVLVRLFTLWWGVAIGALGLSIATRLWGRGGHDER